MWKFVLGGRVRRGSSNHTGRTLVLRPEGWGGMTLALGVAFALVLLLFPVLARAQVGGLNWQCVAGDAGKACPAAVATPVPVAPSAASVGGASIFRSVTLTNSAVAVDASPGTISFIQVTNTGGSAALCYLQLYDLAAASVVVGTTAPTVTLAVAASTVLTLPFTTPLQFSAAISVAATTTAGGSTACSPILQSTLVGYK